MVSCFFFFFNDTATTEIYTLSLHDALPIFGRPRRDHLGHDVEPVAELAGVAPDRGDLFVELLRSEEHTSELQSRQYLVCRLLLEKKNSQYTSYESAHHDMHPYRMSGQMTI